MRGSQVSQVSKQSEMNQSSRSSFQAFEKDYPRFDNLDPSLDGGFKIIYIQELPITIKLLEGIESFNETTNVEPILIKMMQKTTGKEKRLDTIKIELTTEADLFFNFVFEANDVTFLKMKKKQKWNIDFDQLSSSIIKMLTSCQKDPHSFQLAFEINKDLNAELVICQTTEFKQVELMKLDFMTQSQENIRQSVVFRFNLVKAKVMIATQRVNDTITVLQENNPILCDFIKKNTSLVRPKQYSPNY
ncbi:hypothetical protein TTHERM_00919520 (macronuclear) [Tetrahymena thermophila SB210]|uniref:Spindle assembly abnormal protein 6 N-terminal domain-containing protein n=1 Tax=Tetrahymena thermophila (strain SB210) TaxID=312017 RepID=Q24IM2_TETTS|nr:hypothetical protein TTHERM_00919520 [Tetrahymena thermophila SB210]EAS07603.2 hypothetical protein TTHERM_00919520 [Tetrahymena thermophila SB210]|eukprot:XP_001027845.2 hypothetical protein TTHERM_00919520 [Tetrahymena thermophila SB210]